MKYNVRFFNKRLHFFFVGYVAFYKVKRFYILQVSDIF